MDYVLVLDYQPVHGLRNNGRLPRVSKGWCPGNVSSTHNTYAACSHIGRSVTRDRAMCVLGLCQLSTAERTGYALRGKSVRCDKSPVPSKITIITLEKNREYVAAIQDLLCLHYFLPRHRSPVFNPQQTSL